METLSVPALIKLVSTGVNLIYVTTGNERRSESMVLQAAAKLKGVNSHWVWTCTTGFTREGKNADDTMDPVKAIDFALSTPGPMIFLFKDLCWFWKGDPYIQRKLKEFARTAKSKAIVILGSDDEVPEGLREDLTILNQVLPTIEEISSFLAQLKVKEPLLRKALEDNPGLLRDMILASQGVDLADIERALQSFRASPAADGSEMISALYGTKQQIIRRSGIMEFVFHSAGEEAIGGMENLKQWLARRESAFGVENIAAGTKMPKGILLMGIAGCGKSIFVKAIAAKWRLPLIRLDMAAIYDGIHGTPESSLRKAFQTAEAIAPCVLWIDEIESGISSQGFKAEGGSSSRILGSFLTWMQEKKAPVFVAATANAIEMLPAEVLRKGRFDEIFYLGLPDVKAREDIFRIHLTGQSVDFEQFDVSLLAGSTKGFSGAEIEQAVLAAAFEALADHRPMIQQDIMAAISRTVPISVTMAEQIKKIEAWAFKRAVPASGKYNA